MESIKQLYKKQQQEIKPKYFTQNNFRYVEPYEYIFQTYVKERWIGKQLLEIFQKEFIAFPIEYYKASIENGSIKINNKQSTLSYILKQNDLITNCTIRKEPPVYDLPIQIIFESNDLLVINKPSSMPCHEGGSYYFNSLMQYLKYAMGYINLYSMHRLDRLTSGIILLAKQPQLVKIFHQEQEELKIKKVYLARVQGKILEHNFTIDQPIYCVSKKEGIYTCCQKEEMKKYKAKNSITHFKLLAYDENSDSSLVKCKPQTGKTHQIRLHLKYIGHPIWNDECYGGKIVGNLSLMQKIEDNTIMGTKKVKKEQMNFKDQWDLDKIFEICLHSWKYTFRNQQFKSNMPSWCLDFQQQFKYKQSQQKQISQ